MQQFKTYLIVGASRGIGLGFVMQTLALGNIVVATVRDVSAPHLMALKRGSYGDKLHILQCNVSDEKSISTFIEALMVRGVQEGFLARGVIDVVVINAGILEYPGRIGEISFSSFAHHLHTNTIGPLQVASSLLALGKLPVSTTPTSPAILIKTLVFVSSDSGSASKFRGFEDGFGAYSVSKAALNQGLRHLAAELERERASSDSQNRTVVLALHPGEVSTDMANDVDLPWEVEGVIGVEESVHGMLDVIARRGHDGGDRYGASSAYKAGLKYEDEEGEASFWTWEGERYPW